MQRIFIFLPSVKEFAPLRAGVFPERVDPIFEGLLHTGKQTKTSQKLVPFVGMAANIILR